MGSTPKLTGSERGSLIAERTVGLLCAIRSLPTVGPMVPARRDAVAVVVLVIEGVVILSIGLVVAVGASFLDLLGSDVPTALAIVVVVALASLAVALLVTARIIGSRGSVDAWRQRGIVRVFLFVSVAWSAIFGLIGSFMFRDVFSALVAVVGIGVALLLIAAFREARRITEVAVSAPIE